MIRPIVWSFLAMLVLTNVGWGQHKTREKPSVVLDAGGHTATVWKVLFTPDGKQLITASADKTIRIWDVATGQLVRGLRPPAGVGDEGSLYAAAVAPDGKTLAVAGYGFEGGDCGVYLLSLSSGQIERVFKGHTSWSAALAFSRDGKLLASAGSDNTARVWNVATGAAEHLFHGHSDRIYGVAFSPDGQLLATASYDRTARFWSVATGKVVAVLKGHASQLRGLAWSRDGKTLATGSFDQSVRLWNADGSLRRQLTGLGGGIFSVAFSTDSRRLLVVRGGGSSNDCSVVEVATGREQVRFRGHNATVMDGALSPDGLRAATGDSFANVLLWDTADGNLVARLSGKGKNMWSAAWSQDGKSVAWGEEWSGGDTFKGDLAVRRSFRLPDLELGEMPQRVVRARLSQGPVSVTHTGRTTVAVDRQGGPKVELKLSQSNDYLRCCTLLPDDRAVVGAMYGLSLFDTRSGKLLRVFQGHTGEIWAVASSPDGRYVLSASSDQTLRIWNPQREEPLLSLFFAGNEWVAWTPEGYYAASPGGENLMGWHVNNGREQMASYHPAAQFRKSLYRPDVIKLLLRAGSVERALAIADEARGKKTETKELAEVLPPRVRLLAPAKHLQVRDAALEVRARATSTGTHPVTALHLLIDGRPFMGQGGLFRIEAPRLGDVEASWNLTLTPGKHRLTIRAESAVSTALSDEVEIHYVAADKAEQARQPSLYVLSVGISAYPGNLKLNYAAKDAQTLAKTFQDHSQRVFEKIEIKEVTDQKATRREILKGITWLGKQMTQRDVGVVFLAGHGEVANNGVFHFLPADVDPEDIVVTGVSGDQIKATLAAMPGRVIFLLDACHAGGFDKNKKRSVSALTDDLVRDLAADDRGIIVICAATGRQFALESEEHRQGMFTLALVEGLQGKAKQVDGQVYLHHLDAYVTDRVRELSRGQQSPTTARPGSIRSFPLSRPR